MNAKQPQISAASGVAILATLLTFATAGTLAGQPGASGPTLLRQRDVPIVISAPGSYRLSSNLVVTDPSVTAIIVKSDNVTIDLDGFTIHGPHAGPVGAGSGINSDVRSNVSVRNGVVRGFFDPAAACVHLPGSNNRIENVRAENCPQQALFVGASGVITGCQVSFSGAGISADQGSTITNNTLYSNTNMAIFSNIGGLIILGNNCRENNICIRASTSGNRIELNTITENDVGLDLTGGTNNFFARNMFQGNNTAITGSAGNADGAAVDPALSNIVFP